MRQSVDEHTVAAADFISDDLHNALEAVHERRGAPS
jgi:hypothetical protein